jgi:hypothetical protein
MADAPFCWIAYSAAMVSAFRPCSGWGAAATDITDRGPSNLRVGGSNPSERANEINSLRCSRAECLGTILAPPKKREVNGYRD